ncbi:MAG: hypothetical protein NT094_01920, partial [Candidatus Staskawiczbacteria bacterium]|nr:hypothetical protein [Candidatus Staskawiczbacteria bacterium]
GMIIDIGNYGLGLRLLDASLSPAMRILAGRAFFEASQTGHLWNVRTVKAALLSTEMMVLEKGVSDAIQRKHELDPKFHMPLFGGWREYIVLESVGYDGEWSVGWMVFEEGGNLLTQVSLLKQRGRVRVLIGREQVYFFGCDPRGDQISIQKVGKGHIGDGGEFRKVPLR